MSKSGEPPSDPDFDLDYSDLPPTSSVAFDLQPIHRAVRGLIRWAKRQSASRRELRAWALGALLTVIGAAASFIWQASAVNSAVDALRDDIADLRQYVQRVDERQWTGRGPTHTSGGRSAEE